MPLEPRTADLAEIRARINASDLSPAQQREQRSAIDSLARWCHAEPADIPATVPELRKRFATLHPKQLGIGAGRFANVKSLVFKALALARDAARPRRRREPLRPAWRSLYELLPDRHARDALAPFMRWCGTQEIVPERVDEDTSNAYLAHLEATATRGKPRATHQTVIRQWNRAAAAIPGWPARLLVKPDYRKDTALPFAAFPTSFEAEARAWGAVLAGDDLFDEQGPIRPLRPHTIKLRVGILRRVATALVALGHAPDRITGLAYLVVPDHVRAVLRHLHDSNEQPPRALSKVADTLAQLARHHLHRPEAEVRPLRKMAAHLRHREGPKTMSPKARERLQQFEDRHNLAGLFLWPERVVAEVEKRTSPRRVDALRIQIAIAVEVLLHAPLRSTNLAGPRLGLEVDPGQRPTDPLRIVVAAERVKNKQRLEYELPPDAARLVRLYIRKYRPLLSAHPGAALFPGGDKRETKRADSLSKQISAVVWSELGIRVHAHLFRHLAATQYLRRRPGTYETVSRVLGHHSTDMAYLIYAGGEETRAAVAAFDQEVLALQGELRAVSMRGRRNG